MTEAVPAADDSDATDRHPTTAAYDLPELRRAMRARGEGIKKLMKSLGFPEHIFDLGPSSIRVDTDKMVPKKQAGVKGKNGGDTGGSAEQSLTQNSIVRTIDDFLLHFYRHAFAMSEPSLAGISQRIFGGKEFLRPSRAGLAVYSVWLRVALVDSVPGPGRWPSLWAPGGHLVLAAWPTVLRMQALS